MEIHGTGFNNLYRHALSAVLDCGRSVAAEQSNCQRLRQAA